MSYRTLPVFSFTLAFSMSKARYSTSPAWTLVSVRSMPNRPKVNLALDNLRDPDWLGARASRLTAQAKEVHMDVGPPIVGGRKGTRFVAALAIVPGGPGVGQGKMAAAAPAGAARPTCPAPAPPPFCGREKWP